MSSYTLSQLETIAGLIQSPTSIVLTSSNWGRLAVEVGRADLLDPSRRPARGTFECMEIRAEHILRVVNSGTEDEVECDKVNRIMEARSNFIEARDRFAVAKGSKKDALEFIDPESTHELPMDLAKEMIRREELRRAKL